ncbi:copper amine oxidase N-terminal domain-containing protein [Anaerovorax odorimutans]|uniref:copper amine oxidase N-terminal domain-containing protein n=1 Tax=Anaerovorax odorimutans TaxID=109327 RepID=UPI000400C567|nr:copper amine oxidase N-terminal domain-containing protein [Anaerovorax odorimutans]
MKKIFLIAVFSMFFICTCSVCEAYEKPITVKVNDGEIIFNESTGFPYITDTGSTMIPLRVCLNSINCGVEWDKESQTVKSHKGDINVEIPIGRKEIYKNGTTISINTSAIIKDGRSYLPLRTVMEAYDYTVEWDSKVGAVSVVSNSEKDMYSPLNINGGKTGIFSRKQLKFSGFDGIDGDVTLPKVIIAEKGDCPYVYFGFDWDNDVGNVEGGFQFIEDENNPNYNKWTVYMRQGNEWLWGDNIFLDQGSTHHIKFYGKKISGNQVDLIIELDGKEIIRKVSTVTEFDNASVKSVVSMAMSKAFDGSNCMSRLENAKISDLKVSVFNKDQYTDFNDYELYSEFRKQGASGIWFGTVECIPSYIHNESDGTISIYKSK